RPLLPPNGGRIGERSRSSTVAPSGPITSQTPPARCRRAPTGTREAPMLMTDDKARIEYEALLRLARDTERMTFLAWLIPGVTASALLAWGIGTRHPGFMVAVVLTCAIGLLATSRWRERAGSIAGYVETYYESEGENPSYYNRRARLEATLGSGGREWHVVTFFNGVAVAASVFAWMSCRTPTTASCGRAS